MNQRQGSAVAIAHLTGRLVLISSLLGGGLSLGWLAPAMAQTIAQTTDEPSETNDTTPTPANSESPAEPAERPSTRDNRSPLSTARPNLRTGSEGQAVAELQALLKLLGYYTGAVDGRYSEATAQAVSSFQTAAGLTADGVVGPATWGQLLPSAPIASPSTSTTQTSNSTAVTVTDFPTPNPNPAPSTSTPAPTSGSTPTPDSDPATSPTAETTAETADETADEATTATASSSETETEPETTETADIETTGTETTETASRPADSPAAFPTLRLGAYGPAVEQLQERLRSLGHYQGAIDGIFGEQTQEAVKAAQRSNQLTEDGVVGPATWDALLDR